MLGKKRSDKTLKKMSKFQSGPNHSNYKDGVTKLNLPLFDTYNDKIDYAEETRFVMSSGFKLIQVKCSKCNKWFTPEPADTNRRVLCLDGRKYGESRFYCSDDCKYRCEVFNIKLYPRGHVKSSYYGHSVWRTEVLKRANYTCEYCSEDKAVVAHHSQPKKLEPFFALDPDYGITCCIKCHYKYGHTDECSTGFLYSIACGGAKID